MAKKWVAIDFGGPDVLREIEVEIPAPGPGEVTITVRAAGMNPADYKQFASGADRSVLPLSIGYAVAGVINAIGPETEIASGGGKVVVATTNYNPQFDGHIAELDTGTATVAGLIQAHLPYSPVVRAFSHISATEVTTYGEPEGTSNRRALAIAGGDADARRVVADLYNQVGFDTVEIGSLDESWRIDRGQPAFIVPSERRRLRVNVARAKRQT
jgi:predicted dinucleotide-binding enzyme